MREQPWMRHVTHQMTELFSDTKMTMQFLSHVRINCAVRAVNKLYCTKVSCEWMSCLHPPSIFWNSFQETQITTFYQMTWNIMSSNSFAVVNFAAALLKMKTLPTGFSVALCSTSIQFSIDMVIEVFSSFELLTFSLTLLMFWTYRSQRLLRFRQVSVLHFKALF